MRITVIGCGRWGSLIAWYLDRTGHAVTLYGRPGSRHMQRFLATRRNDLLELPESIRLSTDLSCVRQAEIVVISIGSQGLQGLMDQLRPLALGDKIFVLCMKGLEQGTGRRLSQIAQENLDPSNAVAVWLGPGHVQEFYRGIPNCMVIDSSREDVKRLLVQSFSSDLIRFYYGEDLIGNEVGAAAKNVVGIAAGFLDGKGLSSLKGALMSRGTREVARLIQAMGGSSCRPTACATWVTMRPRCSPATATTGSSASPSSGERPTRTWRRGTTPWRPWCCWGSAMAWSCPSAGRCTAFSTAARTPWRSCAPCWTGT